MKSTPLVSVIVTTKNEEKNIGSFLKSVQAQSYKNIEIVVVDHPETKDKTPGIARKFTGNIFIKGPERSYQRNFAVEKSKGKYVLILDADMVLEKDVVKECVEKIGEDSYGALVIPEESVGSGFWAKAKKLERNINKGQRYFEAARFFPKSIFTQFGGYDTDLTGPEDWDLPQRIAKKYPVGRIKSEIKHNEGSPSLISYMRRKYYYGLSVHNYLKKQKLPVIGPTTVYFLRPAFYKSWRKLLEDPVVSLGMVVMLTAETAAGGLGYIMGRIKK